MGVHADRLPCISHIRYISTHARTHARTHAPAAISCSRDAVCTHHHAQRRPNEESLTLCATHLALRARAPTKVRGSVAGTDPARRDDTSRRGGEKKRLIIKIGPNDGRAICQFEKVVESDLDFPIYLFPACCFGLFRIASINADARPDKSDPGARSGLP